MTKYLFLIILSIIYSVLLSITYSLQWVLTIISAALVFGVLGNIVSQRRLYFLAGASPHIALLAITLSIPIYRFIGGSPLIYSIFISLAAIYIVGYMINRGIESNTAVSIVIGLTTSLSVLSIHYVLTHYSIQYNLYSIILGDPLLIDYNELLILVTIAIVFSIISILTYYEQLSISIDPVSTRLSGIFVKKYDLITYTMLGIGVVGLLKITGYILEHVLLLIPPSIAVLISRSARETYLLTIILAVNSSLVGLHFSILLNIPPSGFIGFILLIIYIASMVSKKWSVDSEYLFQTS